MKTNANGWPVFDLADRHRRSFFVEKMSMKQLSGWFLKVEAWETKHTLGYHVFTDSEHADWLYERLQNLRGGQPEASIEPGLLRAVSRNLDAPSEEAFVRGLYLVIKRRLRGYLQETLDHADGAANAFDVRMINRMLPEVDAEIDWARDYLDRRNTTETAAAWEAYIDALIAGAGGLSGTEGASEQATETQPGVDFVVPKEIAFDERVGDRPIMPHEEKIKLDYDDAVLEQFRVFFNEIYAASILASIIHQSFDQAVPWDMIRWFSRHFWDEVRHSQFGAVRLIELGSSPDRCDQTLYRNSQQMPFLHRICYLTLVLEKHYMPRKKPRFEEYGNAGDKRSQLFADHDWSDEMNHVRNGRDWLTRLLEGDARDVSDVERETREILERITGAPVESVSPF